ncbi:tetratricopeptide repeat-containing glycosyltransferase family 2 protein [Sediminibacillus massiliensis]|uniref:tetratricopeptide repeat-containing glycosyltransferase family 2 protein n=1 Tax=Sediminibacillus massiliensis TaxID=1926277 RepID=UPI0015C2CF63|nr:glycosyltransferase [Sediminibacillus massiliensis]
MLIGLHMIVKNESNNLRKCLDSIKTLVDEIIIVDTGSNDNTVSIAEEFNAKVFHKPWEDNFSDARNHSLPEANTDWIIFMDADEIFKGPFQEIRDELEHTDKEAFYIDIESITGEKVYEKMVHPSIRIFRNKKNYFFRGALHEDILPSILDHTSMEMIGKIQEKILHTGYTPIQTKLEKAHRNRRILEKSLKESPSDNFFQYHLGITYEQLSLNEQAIIFMEKALKNVAKHQSYRPTLVKDLAKLYLKTTKYKLAIDLLNNEIKNYNDYPDLYYYLGYGYQQIKENDKAIRILQEATNITPSRHYVLETGKGTYLSWTLMGDIALEWKAYNDALQFYIKALQYCPYHYDALYGIADLLIASGRSCSDIRTELTHILTPSIDPSKSDPEIRKQCLQEIAHVLFDTGCDEEYLDFSENTEGSKEKEILSLLYLNHMQEANNRYERLLKPASANLLQAIIVTFHEHSYPYPEKLYKEIKNEPNPHFYDQILQILTNKRQTKSNNEISFLLFTKQFLHQAIRYRAHSVIRKLIGLHPVFQLYAAKIFYYEGYIKEAYDTFNSLFDQDALDVEGTFLLGEYNYHQKKWEQASILFEKVLTEDADHIGAHIGASLCYNQQSKDLLKESIEEIPDFPLFTAYLNKVELAIELSSKHGWQTHWRGRQRRVRLQNEQGIVVYDS